MKKLLFIVLLSPLLSTSQNLLPRFENDTLYTSSGYKIYKGQLLHLANGTSAAGYFRFIKFHPSMIKNDTYTIQNSTLLVSKLKNYKNTGDDISIRISGLVTLKDNSKQEVDIIMNFEKAIAGSDGLAGELTVPEEFKNKRSENIIAETKKQSLPDEVKKQTIPEELKKLLVADEIKKLFDLYRTGALTKEEYETQKKKLLDNK